MVICLACAADHHARRIAETEALARSLAGATIVESVTGCTTVLSVTIPETSAPRFVAALVLNGATIIGSEAEATSANILVLITAEPKA
jgi:hypothetical protein